jgi:hypothetical protein
MFVAYSFSTFFYYLLVQIKYSMTIFKEYRMKLDRKYRKFYVISRVLLCGLYFVSSGAHSDPVWEIIDGSREVDTLNSIDIPANAFAAVPIDVSFSYLSTLELSDQVEIKISEGVSIYFSIADILNYPNGDLGWNGANDSISGLQTISMTAGNLYFLASIVTLDNSYQVIAKKYPGEGSYVGWLYSERRQNPPPINDELIEVEQRGRSMARFFLIKEPAVTAKKSADLLDGYYADIDKDLIWTFTIENSFDTKSNPLILDVNGPYADDSVNLYANFMNHSDLFDWPSNCQERSFADTDPWKRLGSIRCNIESIAPNSSVSITMKSRLKAGFSFDDLVYGGLSSPDLQIYDPVTLEFPDISYDGYFTGPIPVLDVLKDTDGDGVSDFNEGLLGTDAVDKNSGAHKDVIIDIVVFYTENFKEDIIIDPETKINSAFTIVNEIFKGSNTGIKFNIVHYELLDYKNNCTAERCSTGQRWNDTQTVMAEYGTKGKNQWRFSEKIRALKGADYVMILDGKGGDDPTAGQAASGTNNRGYFGFNKDKRTTFVHYGGWGFDIDEVTMAHELGHMFGNSHSRKQSRDIFGDNALIAGTFPWATGHAIKDEFATIMPYPDKFGNAVSIKRFSDSSRSDCSYFDDPSYVKVVGVACGVDRSDDQNGADAVAAMKIVRYQHEQFSPTRPTLPTSSTDGKSYAAKFLAGSIRDIELGFKTKFTPNEKITTEGAISIAPEHVGKPGTTHIIVDGGALGAFQVNAEGAFVNLDMAAPVLVGSIEPRPLRAIENLGVFNDLVPGDLGVTSVLLNIYFGYTVIDEGLIVYTGSPLVVNIEN